MIKYFLLLTMCICTTGCGMVAWFVPPIQIYLSEIEGESELKKATYSKQVQIQDANGKFEAAKLLAQAEVERAKGVSQANKIIGDSLKNNEQYLKYLWIHNLDSAEKTGQVIYVPTEANMPILEAGKRK